MSSHDTQSPTAAAEREDFIREIVKADLAAGRVREVVTRFPPEPNGYLHVGHAKAICLNFGIARQFDGRCHLRMDDTNPAKEDVEYEDSIVADVRWLVSGWADHCLSFKRRGATAVASGADFQVPSAAAGDADREPFRASDYFDALHALAVRLIERGKAYVCDHTAEEVDRMRGAPGERGEDSHWRGRSVAESLDLFARMKAGGVPGWRAHAARTHRHGVPERLAARSGALPDPPRVAPQYRRALVHLPALRLRARPLGLHRGRHPQPVHAGVRVAPPALRLAARGARPAPPAPPPVRVCAPESHAHGDEQAEAPAPGAGGPRLGLGRPAHAHDQRHAPARLPRGGAARFRGADRRRPP
jgi:hypothetical protein